VSRYQERDMSKMNIDWNTFNEFLRTLGVEMTGSDAPVPPATPEEPLMRILERAREHEAFYRVDWLEATGPELLVLLPTNQAPLKFHIFRVQMSESHPLHDALSQVMEYQGSEGFEQKREVAEYPLLHALVETMKALFWVGEATSDFPPEILVHKLC